MCWLKGRARQPDGFGQLHAECESAAAAIAWAVWMGQAAVAFEDQLITYFVPLNATGGTVSAGGTVTTVYGDGPTVSDPLATTMKVRTGGLVSITEQQLSEQTIAGFMFFGQQVLITAPDATDASNPLLITFDIQFTLVPDGEDAQSIVGSAFTRSAGLTAGYHPGGRASWLEMNR